MECRLKKRRGVDQSCVCRYTMEIQNEKQSNRFEKKKTKEKEIRGNTFVAQFEDL